MSDEPQLEKIEKIYFSISEVAKMFHVAPSLLRFWETEFSILRPKKNPKGERIYRKEDIDVVRTLYHLVKEKRYTLEGAREHMKKNKRSELNRTQLLGKLQSIKAELETLKERL